MIAEKRQHQNNTNEPKKMPLKHQRTDFESAKVVVLGGAELEKGSLIYGIECT